jgi:hypothetical protein
MKRSFVQISNLPINIQTVHLPFFKKYQKQKIISSKIKFLKNVFVNQQGIVLKRGLLVKGCAFNLFGNLDNTFYYSFWRKVVEQFLVSKYGNSLKSIRLDDDHYYLLIHSAWFNYSFWVNSYLIRLISVLKEIEDKTNMYLIFPEEWDNIAYVKDSLQYFDIKLKRIPHDHHIFVKNLIMPETREWTNSFDYRTIRYVYNWFSFLEPTSKPSRKIYLTRKKRNVRCVENENEIINILLKYGFEIFSFEELSYNEQVSLMMESSHFISIHGAGFSNIVFMQKNTSVLELINFEYAKLEYTFPFWKLADTLDINYFYQFGHINENSDYKMLINNDYDLNQNYLVNENINIDIIQFEQNVKLMLNQY